MQVHVLASGSTGNSVFLQCGDTRVLIDAGISTRRIKKELESVGHDIAALDAVLITHEHRDHIAGLTTMAKKYRIPMYARPAAWQAMSIRHTLPDDCCHDLGDKLQLGQVAIEPFPIPHDAADPVGFTLRYGERKCTLATDLGFVTDTVKKALAMSDIMILEANHDVDMLQSGSYPWMLKKRILSNRGHLSNHDSGWTLARLAKPKGSQVFLAHLSQENNCPDLAQRTVCDILSEQGLTIGHDIGIHMTYPDRVSSLICS